MVEETSDPPENAVCVNSYETMYIKTIKVSKTDGPN
jgi:hypothetical protein